MVKKIALNTYQITPIGWKQWILAILFWITGSITRYSNILITDNRKKLKWFL